MLMRILQASTIPLLFMSTAVLAEPVTLNVTYSSNAYTAVLEQTAAAFEKVHPDIRIKYRTPVPNTYDQLLQLTIRSSAINDVPDVSIQGNQNIPVLASRGLAIPLDDLIRNDRNWAGLGYAPSLAKFGQVSGKSYALAYATSVPIVYLNVDLLKKSGVSDVDQLKSWEDLTAASKKVQALGQRYVGGMFDYQSAGNWTFQALVTSQGTPFMTDDGSRIAFNGKSGLKALQVLRRFGEAGTVDMTQPQMLQAFAAGTVGVFASYSTAIGEIEQMAHGAFKLKALAWPMIAEDGRLPAGGRAVVIFAKDRQRQQASWEFAKFLVGPVSQTMLVKETGAVPVNTVAIERPEMLGNYYRQNPTRATALSAVSRLTGWSTYPGQNPVKTSEMVKDNLRRVLIERQDPQQVLDRMVADISTLTR
jgi:multiple sugar transport system substrate-binding protein